MNSVVRNVANLSADERHVYESVLEQPLRDDQQVIIQLVGANEGVSSATTNGSEKLPAWYAIWAELGDQEIAELESAILERSESRSI